MSFQRDAHDGLRHFFHHSVTQCADQGKRKAPVRMFTKSNQSYQCCVAMGCILVPYGYEANLVRFICTLSKSSLLTLYSCQEDAEFNLLASHLCHVQLGRFLLASCSYKVEFVGFIPVPYSNT